ncbi:MAG: hypoxanthine phosphoribosyltransferase [Phycisphaeraceae bacterium]|nr:hypoxanthine phosphoribosyltransferase [Phycisphaeraceae bacterium]
MQAVLLDRQAIARRVGEVAEAIVADLPGGASGGDVDLTLVPILTGSLIFVADLVRRLPLRLRLRMMALRSYVGTESRGAQVVEELTNLPASFEGAHVLVVDDILDSGRTLRLAKETLAGRGAASIRTCVLLRKDRAEARAFAVDYVGFDIPDAFVVGYGLDYNDYYRNLPDIVTLKPAVIRGAGQSGAAVTHGR